jgi:Lon-like ATP-dependent protease
MRTPQGQNKLVLSGVSGLKQDKGKVQKTEAGERIDQSKDLAVVDEWIKQYPFLTTEEIEIPPKLVDQVIGQEAAVEVIRKAAEQKRHVMLIGDPGTGKSMLARSMAELLPQEELQDVIIYHNPDDNNQPKVRVVPAGKGKDIVSHQKKEAQERKSAKNNTVAAFALMIVGLAFAYYLVSPDKNTMIILLGLIAGLMIFMFFRYSIKSTDTAMIPKLLMTHTPDDKAPFIDATGAHAGALLGDVKHDPFQSGGLETPAHERVEAGAIHRAHRGVLFCDEINILKMESQQSLLTAMQEKEFSIVGQSERSSGAMVKTEPVPCDFVLVAAGNLDAVQGMHPALRSRIRGYGYEIFMKSTMPDTHDNREKLVRFIAQEVHKDKKIPNFDRGAVALIIKEAQRRSGTRGHLTLRLRELGGLVRVAGDIAHEDKAPIVTSDHVLKAKKIARSLEQQIADVEIEKRKAYKSYMNTGAEVGRVNGLAVIGAESGISEYSGVILPIVAAVTQSTSSSEGHIIATGKLGEIAKEAVQNVSALIKNYTGDDVSKFDYHIQFIGTYEGVEGDSASISVATAAISALENVAVDQSVAMTGSLSVRGQVLPVGGVTAKIEAAAEAGMKRILIPALNVKDVLIEEKYKNKIEIVPMVMLTDVLQNALVGPGKDELIKKFNFLVEPNPREKAAERASRDKATPHV